MTLIYLQQSYQSFGSIIFEKYRLALIIAVRQCFNSQSRFDLGVQIVALDHADQRPVNKIFEMIFIFFLNYSFR